MTSWLCDGLLKTVITFQVVRIFIDKHFALLRNKDTDIGEEEDEDEDDEDDDVDVDTEDEETGYSK